MPPVDRYTLHTGDCLAVMGTMQPNSCDTIVTDPPYALTNRVADVLYCEACGRVLGGKDGKPDSCPRCHGPLVRRRAQTGAGFMGKDWDTGDVAFHPAIWKAALRVAKPGAMLLAFGGTRTFHRLTCAIEDAGWEVRDVIMWLYGSGFPKSHDISKGIDKAAGEVREVVGAPVYADGKTRPNSTQNAAWSRDKQTAEGYRPEGDPYPWETNPARNITAPATPLAAQWQGWGTALKPAWEPIIVAMKPLDGTFAQNAQRHGVAGLNIEGGRIAVSDADKSAVKNSTRGPVAGMGYVGNFGLRANFEPVEYNPSGRWPANLILDEDAAAALDEQSGSVRSSGHVNRSDSTGGIEGFASGKGFAIPGVNTYSDTGGASRFFYVAKASRAEREAGLEGQESNGRQGNRPGSPDPSGKFPDHDHRERGGNHHPTVKPLTLMRYLVRLTATPTGGVVLDPFMGSGTTGVAAMMEGRTFIGIERESEYVEIAGRRIEHAAAQPRQEGLL